jgi:hypothetical protein
MTSLLLSRAVSTAAGVSTVCLVLCFAVLTRGAAGLAGRAVSVAGFAFFAADLPGIVALISSIEGLNYISAKKCFI